MIQKGADPDLCDNDGWSPVYRAALINKLDMVKALVNHKANVNIPDRRGHTALDVTKNQKYVTFYSNMEQNQGKNQANDFNKDRESLSPGSIFMEKFDLRTDETAEIINSCLEALKQPGAVLLIPTETVYGLVCRWNDKTAVKRIYELKGREKAKPLALFVDSVNTLKKFDFHLNENAEKLASKLCPGALTVVVPTSTGDTLGFRIPDHPFVLKLLRELVFRWHQPVRTVPVKLMH